MPPPVWVSSSIQDSVFSRVRDQGWEGLGTPEASDASDGGAPANPFSAFKILDRKESVHRVEGNTRGSSQLRSDDEDSVGRAVSPDLSLVFHLSLSRDCGGSQGTASPPSPNPKYLGRKPCVDSLGVPAMLAMPSLVVGRLLSSPEEMISPETRLATVRCPKSRLRPRTLPADIWLRRGSVGTCPRVYGSLDNPKPLRDPVGLLLIEDIEGAFMALRRAR